MLLSGEVQDSPFLERLGRALAGRTATLRRVAAGLELRLQSSPGARPAGAKRSAAALVQRAARASRCEVEIVSFQATDDSFAKDGVHWLAPSPGTSDSHLAVPAPPRDKAPCPECRRDFSREGRRHGYLSTECLRCGPRYSHASSFPLTRSSYGMGALPPCAACNAEADDTSSRRFGSQRVSCGQCGPTLTWLPAEGAPFVRGALHHAAQRLRAGEVVAVQTPYGYVAVAAADHRVALRLEVGDEFAPFSLVVASEAAARRVATLSAADGRALSSPAAPEVWAAPTKAGAALARELAVFGEDLRIRLPDGFALEALTAEAGPLALAAASRGGQFLPREAREPPGLPSASWLTDGSKGGDPLGPSREYRLGAKRVLLAHGRGTLPASVEVDHDRTVLALGSGSELFGAVAFGGRAHLTGSAGPASRSQAAERLRRLVSRAAALSPAAAAENIDAVATGPEEGTPLRLVAEETAEAAGCKVVDISPALARAAAATPVRGRAAPVVVLGSDEASAAGDQWLGAPRTGGDVLDVPERKVVGGIAPFELVESPGGRADLVAPLASMFYRAQAPVPGSSKEDAPLLAVLRTRAQAGTSFSLLVDGVAAAQGLVPRRAPPGSGVAEVGRALLDPSAARRFRFRPRIVSARGSRQLDASDLVAQWAEHWNAATRREGQQLPWARRASLAASFAHALLDGIALSTRRSLGRPGAVVLTGTAFASPAVARAAIERFRAAGLSPAFPTDVPILDGAVPIGQARLAFGPVRRAPRKR